MMIQATAQPLQHSTRKQQKQQQQQQQQLRYQTHRHKQQYEQEHLRCHCHTYKQEPQQLRTADLSDQTAAGVVSNGDVVTQQHLHQLLIVRASAQFRYYLSVGTTKVKDLLFICGIASNIYVSLSGRSLEWN